MRRIFGNILLAVASTLLSLELFSFIAVKEHLLFFNETPWIYVHPIFGTAWRTQVAPWGPWHRVHATARHRKGCFDVTYRSNNFGARDDDFTFRKTDSRPRFLLLGDSFAEGWGVDIKDTAQAQLERRLGVDVYNLGVAPWAGPVQYYLIHKSFAARFQHDGVIVFFLPANDFTDDDYQLWMKSAHGPDNYRAYYRKAAAGTFDIVYPPGTAPQDHAYEGTDSLPAPAHFLMKYTYMANTLRTIKYLFINRQIGRSGYFDAPPEEQQAAIYFLKKIVADNGDKPIVILVIPTQSDLNNIRIRKRSYAGQYWYKQLTALDAARSNVAVIDMAPSMPTDYSKFFLSCDGHWNAAGHALAAKLVAARLRTLLGQPTM